MLLGASPRCRGIEFHQCNSVLNTGKFRPSHSPSSFLTDSTFCTEPFPSGVPAAGPNSRRRSGRLFPGPYRETVVEVASLWQGGTRRQGASTAHTRAKALLSKHTLSPYTQAHVRQMDREERSPTPTTGRSKTNGDACFCAGFVRAPVPKHGSQ